MKTNTLTRTQVTEKSGKSEYITYEKTHRPEGYVSDVTTLEGLRDSIEAWRLTKDTPRSKMPDQLWQAVIDFCISSDYTHWQVSHRLRLDGVTLRAKVQKRQAELAAEKEAAAVAPSPYQMGAVDKDWFVTCKRADGSVMNLSGTGHIPDLNITIGTFLTQAA